MLSAKTYIYFPAARGRAELVDFSWFLAFTFVICCRLSVCLSCVVCRL